MKRRVRSVIAAVLAVSAAVGATWVFTSIASAQDIAPLPPGVDATAQLAARTEDLWQFYGCAGDAITLTMTSDAFAPYLALQEAEREELLAEGETAEGSSSIQAQELAATGTYTITAAGERRNDAGDYTLRLSVPGDELIAGADGALTYGMVVTGAVRSRLGELWGFYGCAGDIVTATMSSATFTPFLDIIDLESEESLVDSGEAVAPELAIAGGFELPANGLYGIVAAGERSTARGAYTVTLLLGGAPAAALAGQPPVAVPTPGLPTGPVSTCTANVQGLNLRSGPGTVYVPPIGSLPLGSRLRAVARDPGGQWIQVVVVDTGESGWVSAAPQFVTCSITIPALPVGVIPPTPTPAPTATPTPRPTLPPTPTRTAASPTPTPPAFVLLPGGGPGGDLAGDLVSDPAIVRSDGNVATFRDSMFLRLELYNTPDNRRVQRVVFSFFDPNSFSSDPVFVNEEGTRGYCSFGGGEPICNYLQLRAGATWPDTNIPIHRGNYNVTADVFLEGDDFATGTWNAPIFISSPNLPDINDQGNGNQNPDTGGGGSDPQPLEVAIVETGAGDNGDFVAGVLAFRVAAFDPNVGSGDGDGIDFVQMSIFGPDGQLVRDRREGTAGYCIFQGGEPDCNLWDFAANGYAWPDGASFTPGPHRLVAEVHADDGRVVTVERVVEIQ